MKKILLATCLLIASLICKGQISPGLGLGIGYSSQNVPVCQVQLSVNVSRLIIVGDIQCPISTKVDQPAIFQSKMGYEITVNKEWGFYPMIGYAYHYGSADQEKYNHSAPVFTLQFEKQLEVEFGKLFYSLTYSRKIFMATIGLKGVIH